ncbi:Uncharacterised protein [uncultured archaeon]|nr:Uncharacterised protein [uncultured archaeon]
MFDDNAQLHTLEGVAASILLLGVIIYAIDATSMTPLTSSTSNAHVESELAALGQDLLNTLDYAEPGYNSKLKNDIIKWDGRVYLWNGTRYIENSDPAYPQNVLINNLTDVLNSTLISQGIAHKVELTYIRRINNNTVPSESVQWIYAGVPSSNAVIVSRKIVLQKSDLSGLTLANYTIKSMDPMIDPFNIIDVKLVLWRT